MKTVAVTFLITLPLLRLIAATTQRLDEFRRTPANPVLEGDIVTVVCTGAGVSLRWHINGQQISNSATGIYKVNTSASDGFTRWTSSLVTTATVARNSTRITCSFTGSSTGVPEESTTIIIAGPPLTPSSSLLDVQNGSVLQLAWEEPYAPTLYPTTGYQVLITSGSNVLVNSSLNSSSLNSSHLHYDFAKPENYIMCEMIEFAVSAISVLGSSNKSTEMGMFPRIPDASHLQLNREIVFKGDGTPRLTVWFNEPEVCTLQDPVNYTMEVLDERGMVAVTSGLKIARGFQGIISTVFEGGLPENTNLSVRVSFSHSAMSWTSQSTLNLNINIPVSTEPLQTDSPVSTSSQTPSNKLDSTTLIVIIVVAVGVVVLICVIMIVFVALIFVWNKGRRPVITAAVDFSPGIIPVSTPEFKLAAPPKGRKVPNKLPTMESNPIYDGHGHVYESPGGDSLKQLLGNSSVPGTPATETPRYFGMPPSLPPPRKNMADRPLPGLSTSSSSSTSSIPNNDVYTEMKPTGRGNGIPRPPDVLPAVYEAMGGELAGDALYATTQ